MGHMGSNQQGSCRNMTDVSDPHCQHSIYHLSSVQSACYCELLPKVSAATCMWQWLNSSWCHCKHSNRLTRQLLPLKLLNAVRACRVCTVQLTTMLLTCSSIRLKSRAAIAAPCKDLDNQAIGKTACEELAYPCIVCLSILGLQHCTLVDSGHVCVETLVYRLLNVKLIQLSRRCRQ
jgi:hypothetical protein